MFLDERKLHSIAFSFVTYKVCEFVYRWLEDRGLEGGLLKCGLEGER